MSSPQLYRVAGVLGWLAVGTVVAGIVVSLIPVSNPGVQGCGAPMVFLASGELDRRPDASGRVERDGKVVTLDDAERERALESPCSERVERRAIPAAILVVAGSVIGLTAVTIGIIGAWRRAVARVPAEADQSGVP